MSQSAQSTSQPQPEVSREIVYIESVHDENRITYEESSGALIMKAPTTEAGYNQYFVKDPIPGPDCESKFKLYVYDYKTNRKGDAVEGTKFFDFNPQISRNSPLFLNTKISATGRSQMWDIQKHKSKKCRGAWLIESDVRFVKNNGTGKPISVDELKRPKYRDDKYLWWRLTIAN